VREGLGLKSLKRGMKERVYIARLKSDFGNESGFGSEWNYGNATGLNWKMREKVTLIGGKDTMNKTSFFLG
jgi:hypothetical protein